MGILSVQSWVAYGHVGNASAVFPLQRLGHEVWAINTVQFSNHTGYGRWTGEATPPAVVAALVRGVAERGVLPGCEAVLSGYMGEAGVVGAVLDAVRLVRDASPGALYCCDPVIGDDGPGVFVRPGIAGLMRERVVPAADILTPNQFELRHLTGLPCATTGETRAAIAALRARMAPGARRVLVTSHRGEDTPGDAMELLAADDGGVFRLRHPRLPIAPNGVGDLVAALFLHHVLRGAALPEALSATASSAFGILARTVASGSGEIELVRAQEEIVRPGRWFESVRL